MQVLSEAPVSRPIFYKHADAVYTADSCAPLKAAMADGRIESTAWSRGQYPGVKLTKTQMPGIRSIGIWDIDTVQDWCIPPHHNEGFEVCMVLNGNIGFEVEGARTELRRGSLTVTKPWQLHSLGAPHMQPNQLIYFILDVGVRRPNSQWVWPNWFLASGQEQQRLGEAITFTRQNVFHADPLTIQLFEQLFATVQQTPDIGVTKSSILVNAALIALLEMLEHSDDGGTRVSTSEETVRHFFSKLAEHLALPWTLEEMADQCGVSRSQFGMLCKEITNQSPMTRLNNLRLEHAAELLISDPSLSVTDICFESGFNSSQYFSRKFLERFGLPPREYRKSSAQPPGLEG
jgi:AraC family transcriptional regulator, L-rhamnose operon regulatory protein RhaS